MKNNLRIVAIHLIPALLIVALCWGSLNARINLPQDTQTRRLWDSEFVKDNKTDAGQTTLSRRHAANPYRHR